MKPYAFLFDRNFPLRIARMVEQYWQDHVARHQDDDDRFEIVWTFHHIVCDGWSRPILLGEFWRCYEAFAAHRAIDLPAVRPYSRYIARVGRDAQSAERFWRYFSSDTVSRGPERGAPCYPCRS